LSDIFRIASSISVVVPLIVYLTRIRYATRRIHIIGAVIVLSALSDLAGMILFRQHISTVLLFNLYYAMLFFLLTWFYYEILFSNTRRVLVWVGLAVYLQSFLLVSIYVQSIFEYQTLLWVITAVIMIVYSIAYFFYSFSTIPASNIFGYTLIWINCAIMIYFSMNLFLFVMGNHVLTKLDPEMSLLVWSFHNVNNIIKNILFSIGLFFFKKKVADF
jgi:hypothetical protein